MSYFFLNYMFHRVCRWKNF